MRRHAAWILVVVGQGMAGCREAGPPAPEDAGITAEQTPATPSASSSGPSSAPAPARRALKGLACGAYFACTLDDGGKVWCWGRNDHGQLAVGAPSYEDFVPSRGPVEQLAVATAITAGDEHACALLQGGDVACWGGNSAGQLGDGTEIVGIDADGMSRSDPRSRPIRVAGLPEPAVAIAAGSMHTCAILASRRVACWGENMWKQLGDPGGWRSVPKLVAGVEGVEELALGTQHTCARTARGDVTCWGESSSVPGGSSRGPSAVAGLCAKQISAGDRFTCASSCADQVLCWGDVPYTQRPVDRPSAVPQFPAPAIEVRAGDGHVCARDANGRLWCWGNNASGQLGDGTTERRSKPTAISLPNTGPDRLCAAGAFALLDIREGGERVYGYQGTTCALSTSGGVFCWGEAVKAKRPTLVDLTP